jgi:hypothetical protein
MSVCGTDSPVTHTAAHLLPWPWCVQRWLLTETTIAPRAPASKPNVAATAEHAEVCAYLVPYHVADNDCPHF